MSDRFPYTGWAVATPCPGTPRPGTTPLPPCAITARRPQVCRRPWPLGPSHVCPEAESPVLGPYSDRPYCFTDARRVRRALRLARNLGEPASGPLGAARAPLACTRGVDWLVLPQLPWEQWAASPWSEEAGLSSVGLCQRSSCLANLLLPFIYVKFGIGCPKMYS